MGVRGGREGEEKGERVAEGERGGGKGGVWRKGRGEGWLRVPKTPSLHL